MLLKLLGYNKGSATEKSSFRQLIVLVTKLFILFRELHVVDFVWVFPYVQSSVAFDIYKSYF